MLFWSLIRDGRKSRFRMNIPDNFPESSETLFWVKKYPNSLMRIRIRVLFDPGCGMEKLGFGIRFKHSGSRTLLPMF
jgi:hypothetical protein